MFNIGDIVRPKNTNDFYVIYGLNGGDADMKYIDTVTCTILEGGLTMNISRLLVTDKRPKSQIHKKILERWSDELKMKEKWKLI